MRRGILALGERPYAEIVREQLKLWTARARSVNGGTGEGRSAGSSSS
jgi:hypothetical protein